MYNKVILTDSSTGTQYQVKPLLPESFYSKTVLTPNAEMQLEMDYHVFWNQTSDCNRDTFYIEIESSHFEIVDEPYPKDRNHPYFYDVDEEFYFRQEVYVRGTFTVTLNNGDVHTYSTNGSHTLAIGYGTLRSMDSTLAQSHTLATDWWWYPVSSVTFTGTIRQRLLLSPRYFNSTRALFCYQFPDGYAPNNRTERVFPMALSSSSINQPAYKDQSYDRINWNFYGEHRITYDLDSLFSTTVNSYARLL